VVDILANTYKVTAVQETLSKTNLGKLAIGELVNLERCMQLNGRFDGHIVQGHVDQTGLCLMITEQDGSWLFDFEYDPSQGNFTVEKGSICVNGVSLTAYNTSNNGFRVAIIPYTFHHTNFQNLKKGDLVNLEFDIIGKYLMKIIPEKYRNL
jgi:riboflavin synthase